MNSSEKKDKQFIWAWSQATGLGFKLIQATVATYFSVFMTDTFGVAAGAASLIMLVATIWDAINDPLIGTAIDRTKSKRGRYRPYFLIIPAALTVVSYFLFLAPQGLSDSQKIIYISVFYIAFGMLVTAIETSTMAVLPTQSVDDKYRNKAITISGTFIALAFTIAATFMPSLLKITNGSYAPWMLVFGVIMIAQFYWLYKTSTEKYIVQKEKRPIKEDLKSIFRHKEVYPVILVWCLSSIGYGLMFASSVYYMLYYIARPDLIGAYMGLTSIAGLLSMMIVMPIVMKICKTGDKAFVVTQAVSLVCYVILFFVGKNSLTFLFVVSFIAALFGSMQMALINILINDTIDFIQLKEGVTLGGTISAIKGFSYKVGTTVTNSGILAVLAITGYIAGAVGQQPESVLIGLNMLRFGIPALTCLLIILLLIKYPYAKYMPEITEMKAKEKIQEK